MKVVPAAGAGPFGGERSGESLLSLQAFIGVTTVTALTLAAAVSGHRASTRELRSLSVEMEQLALTDELTGLRNRRGSVLLTGAAHGATHARSAHWPADLTGLGGQRRAGHGWGRADRRCGESARPCPRERRRRRVGGDESAALAVLTREGRLERASIRAPPPPSRGQRRTVSVVAAR
jgi:hypothetical protein